MGYTSEAVRVIIIYGKRFLGCWSMFLWPMA